MKLVVLENIFDINYGNSLELYQLKSVRKLNKNSVFFVSRTAKNNGVSAIVKLSPDIKPIPANTISVSVGGSILEAFLQVKPYYTGYHIMYLTPKIKLSKYELLFYCYCIRKNKFKYSYGRQANRTLSELVVPSLESIPNWVYNVDKNKLFSVDTNNFSIENNSFKGLGKNITINTLFKPINGLTSSRVIRFPNKISEDCIPYIRPSNRQETSIDAYVEKNNIPNGFVFPKHTIYVSTDGQGSHTYSYVSTSEFVPNSNVTVLIPRRKMGIQEKIYYSMLITKNRYKFSYGRKPKKDRLKNLLVPEYPMLDINKENYLQQFYNSVI